MLASSNDPHPEAARRPSRRTHGRQAVSLARNLIEEGRWGAFLYILRCADGLYYVGTTRGSLEQRVAEHQTGAFDGFTARRRPVMLVFQQEFARIEDAVAAERQVKGWRREKKEALIRADFAALPVLSRRAAKPGVRASRRIPGCAGDAPQHEEESLMASTKPPHPEERPQDASRRTHGVDPSRS